MLSCGDRVFRSGLRDGIALHCGLSGDDHRTHLLLGIIRLAEKSAPNPKPSAKDGPYITRWALSGNCSEKRSDTLIEDMRWRREISGRLWVLGSSPAMQVDARSKGVEQLALEEYAIEANSTLNPQLQS